MNVAQANDDDDDRPKLYGGKANKIRGNSKKMMAQGKYKPTSAQDSSDDQTNVGQ